MKEVTVYNESLAQTLRSECSSLYFLCVLNGVTKGKAWVDSIEAPTYALVWSEYQEGFQFMGTAPEKVEYSKFAAFYQEILHPFCKERKIDTMEIGIDHNGFLEMIQEVFSAHLIFIEKQHILELDSYKKPSKLTMPAVNNQQIAILPVNEQFFLTECKNRNIKNREYVIEELELSYGSIDRYLRDGYGYVAVHKDQIVAKSIMTFTFDHMDNISVDTLEEFRRQGLSSTLASLVLKTCLEKGHVPVWDCSDDNTASRKTAEKIGLKLKRYDDICCIQI